MDEYVQYCVQFLVLKYNREVQYQNESNKLFVAIPQDYSELLDDDFDTSLAQINEMETVRLYD